MWEGKWPQNQPGESAWHAPMWETKFPASDLTVSPGLLTFLQPQAQESPGVCWNENVTDPIYYHWVPRDSYSMLSELVINKKCQLNVGNFF